MAEDAGVVRNLLAMILVQGMKDATGEERVVALSRAGMANDDIAALTGSTRKIVAQQLYKARSRTRRARNTRK